MVPLLLARRLRGAKGVPHFLEVEGENEVLGLPPGLVAALLVY